MKKLLLFLTISAGLLLFSACNQPISTRFDSFVTSVQSKCDAYTDADWLNVMGEFKALYNEFNSTVNDITPNDQALIQNDIDLFLRYVLRSGNEHALLELKECKFDPGYLFWIRVNDVVGNTPSGEYNGEVVTLIREYNENKSSYSEEWKDKIEKKFNSYIAGLKGRSQAMKELLNEVDTAIQTVEGVQQESSFLERIKQWINELF